MNDSMRLHAKVVLVVAALVASALFGSSEIRALEVSSASGLNGQGEEEEIVMTSLKESDFDAKEGNLSLRTISHSMTRGGQVRLESSVVVRRVAGQGAVLRLRLRNYRSHCSPVPTFSASLSEGGVVLRQEPPNGPLARCMGWFQMELELRGDGIPSSGAVLLVQDREGNERMRGRIQ